MEPLTDSSDYSISMDVLDTEVCWRLISRTRFGRVGFVVDGEPGVLPVNCGVLDRQLVFRTGRDMTLGQLAGGTTVAFEFDHLDPVAESGWSVLVRGSIWVVDDPDELARLTALDNLHPWAPGVKDRYMKIVPAKITGRVISRHRDLPPGIHVPYMPPD
jgi:nitroimidazol reductase NimA-like FMN-containing flavoprotein (pyridoxamine 5'-phosphate oxidase superfamily)